MEGECCQPDTSQHEGQAALAPPTALCDLPATPFPAVSARRVSTALLSSSTVKPQGLAGCSEPWGRAGGCESRARDQQADGAG